MMLKWHFPSCTSCLEVFANFYNTEASMERMNSGDCWSFVSFLQLRGEVLLNQFTAMETTLFLNPGCASNLSPM